jgi:hypothetical protein
VFPRSLDLLLLCSHEIVVCATHVPHSTRRCSGNPDFSLRTLFWCEQRARKLEITTVPNKCTADEMKTSSTRMKCKIMNCLVAAYNILQNCDLVLRISVQSLPVCLNF